MTPAEHAFSAERWQIIAALERSHFWFVARRALVERLLARVGGPSTGLVVDVGCGTGALAHDLAARGARVLALDLRAEGLARLRAGGSRAWVARALTSHLPVADDSVQVALALDVLEHTDDDRSLAEIARALRPGGAVIITVPALPWLWSARDNQAGHLRRYTRRSLLALVRRAGLEPLDIRFYQCLLLPFFVMTRLLGRVWHQTQRAEQQPGGPVNALCLAVNRAEVALGDYIRWPIGSSLAAVARRPA
ncbi:MAG TPA: class I SAM-dependent methyltransferase [Vicinamibacterales bacterium]|nr:class I SAM-dependent methyltransferase [Vicinamibacterales bacterium]